MRKREKDLLKPNDFIAIKKWIKKLKRNKYSPSFRGDTPAWKKLKLPYKALGCGRNRIVYDLENGCVLKVAISLKGLEDCVTENKIYNTVPKYLKTHLAEIIGTGKGWIIMKAIHKVAPKTQDYQRQVINMRRDFEEFGIKPVDITRKKAPDRPIWRNIRLRKKKLTIIDYGNFEMDREEWLD